MRNVVQSYSFEHLFDLHICNERLQISLVSGGLIDQKQLTTVRWLRFLLRIYCTLVLESPPRIAQFDLVGI